MPPLSGVRVIDLTRLLPGAFATLMLAELGAEIIKIEDAANGDPTRALPPNLNGVGLYHQLLNRGKKSVALNLRDAASASIVAALIDSADVVVESFRPSTARAMGVSAAQTRAARPRLIHCAITGYGQTGPYAERPGHDLNYVAESGMLAVDRPGVTTMPKMFIGDVGGGAMSAVAAILAALFGRERTGDGASLDISMHDALVYWLMLPAARDLVPGGSFATGDLPTFGDHATYNVFDTRDGQRVALGALEPKFWKTFCDVVGRPEWVARQYAPGASQHQLLDDARALFLTRTRDEWLQAFAEKSACLSPVNEAREVFADVHVAARGLVVDGDGLRSIRSPFAMTPASLSAARPLGADTDEILGGLKAI